MISPLLIPLFHSTSCAITYYLAANPRCQEKLQLELDSALGNEDDVASTFESTKRLTYLEAVINESIRLHSTSGIGLPRVAPQGGLEILGKTFPEGTVLSVPSYTIHRDTAVWGDDPDAFRPERWFEQDNDAIQKTFNPFSFGPRYVTFLACEERRFLIYGAGHVSAATSRAWNFSSSSRRFSATTALSLRSLRSQYVLASIFPFLQDFSQKCIFLA